MRPLTDKEKSNIHKVAEARGFEVEITEEHVIYRKDGFETKFHVEAFITDGEIDP
jgi:hypothetical protein